MKTSAELKRFCKEKLGMTNVRVRTLSGKSKWQEIRVPLKHNPIGTESLVWDGEPFPEDFRKRCLGIIYGKESPLAEQISGGNVNQFSVCMSAQEWEQVIVETI